jgi:hypothetical protein
MDPSLFGLLKGSPEGSRRSIAQGQHEILDSIGSLFQFFNIIPPVIYNLLGKILDALFGMLANLHGAGLNLLGLYFEFLSGVTDQLTDCSL